MEYLARDAAPFSNALWQSIDSAVVASARETLVGRRFLPFYGPLGAGVEYVRVDSLSKAEQHEDGLAIFTGRGLYQLPLMYEDFWLYWRDLQHSAAKGMAEDLSAARAAAQRLALREDNLIFYGEPRLGIEGVLNAKGANTLKMSDWTKGEGSFTDVAAGIALLVEKGRIGRHTLVVSQDVYVALQRIQPGTGEIEVKRIEKLLANRVFTSPILKPKTAVLLSADSQYMDFCVGVDMGTAYSEQDEHLNHHLRVMETAMPRIKAADAIVVYK